MNLKEKSIGLIFLFFLSVANFAFSNENKIEKEIAKELTNIGFENVVVLAFLDSILVTYENRVFRYEAKVIQEVLSLLQNYDVYRTYIIIPQNRGIPAFTVLCQKKSDFSNILSVEVSFSVQPFWKKIKDKYNNSIYKKIDLVVYPQISAQFGSYGDPVVSRINCAPTLSTYLWQGMLFSFQYIWTVHNEFSNPNKGSSIGFLVFNQTLRLPYNLFSSITFGIFTKQRYGFDIETKKYWNDGKLVFGAEFGYTGHSSYQNKVLYYSDLDQWTYLLNAQYRFSKSEFCIKTTYGKFLYDDSGWRFDFSRQFNEINIGFFAMKTEAGRNGGFTFSIPIFPGKYSRRGPLQIRPAKYFSWEYRYRGLQKGGENYDVGGNVHKYLEQINPIHIQNQILTFY